MTVELDRWQVFAAWSIGQITDAEYADRLVDFDGQPEPDSPEDWIIRRLRGEEYPRPAGDGRMGTD